MNRKWISILINISLTTVAAVLTLALCLNILTLWSVAEIKRGATAQPLLFCAIVGSGSMEPTASVDDLLLIQGGTSYQQGDVITYVSPKGTLITHRVKEVLPQNTGYITQGDANNIPDKAISPQRVLGRVIIIVPFVGGIVYGLLSPGGLFLMVCAFLGIWLVRKVGWRQNEGT